MDIDINALLNTIGILFGIALGAIGAVPQIIKWSKPKPQLTLTYYDFKGECMISENKETNGRTGCLHIILNNDNILWHRSKDATSVKVECHIIDMNRDQCGNAQTFVLSENLPVGESGNKFFSIQQEGCRKELNPHALVFKIVCKEGRTIKREIPFEYLGLVS